MYNNEKRNEEILNLMSSTIAKETTEERMSKTVNGAKIELDENLKIPESSIKSFNTTIGEECKLFSSVLKSAVKGYVGCRPELRQNINGKTDIVVSIIIDPLQMEKDKSDNKVSIINDTRPSKVSESSDMLDQLKYVTSYNKTNRYVISKDGKSILSDFCRNVNKIIPIIQPTNSGELIIIKELEFNKIISLLYGRKSKDLGRLEYDIIMTNYADLRSQKSGIANIIINIQQYNEKEIKSLQDKLCINYYNNTGLDFI